MSFVRCLFGGNFGEHFKYHNGHSYSYSRLALEAETGEQTDLQGKAQETSGAVPVTPGATSVLIRGAKEGSSVVKYKITATPGFVADGSAMMGRVSEEHLFIFSSSAG